MRTITVTVGSVTYAIKLRKLLLKAGINSRLIRVDNSKDNGCSHGVEISEEDFYSAVLVMRENRIQYSVYEERR